MILSRKYISRSTYGTFKEGAFPANYRKMVQSRRQLERGTAEVLHRVLIVNCALSLLLLTKIEHDMNTSQLIAYADFIRKDRSQVEVKLLLGKTD